MCNFLISKILIVHILWISDSRRICPGRYSESCLNSTVAGQESLVKGLTVDVVTSRPTCPTVKLRLSGKFGRGRLCFASSHIINARKRLFEHRGTCRRLVFFHSSNEIACLMGRFRAFSLYSLALDDRLFFIADIWLYFFQNSGLVRETSARRFCSSYCKNDRLLPHFTGLKRNCSMRRRCLNARSSAIRCLIHWAIRPNIRN